MEETPGKDSPFQKIDNSIFKAIDDFQESASYNKIADSLETLDDTSRNLVAYIIGYILILLPFLLAAFLYLRNADLREELEIKQETLTTAQNFLKRRQQIDGASRTIVSSTLFPDQKSVRDAMSGHLENIGIDSNTVTILGFQQENLSATMLQTQVEVTFKEIALPELMRLFNLLSVRSKFKINHLAIKKAPKASMLSGKFGLVHFGKIQE